MSYSRFVAIGDSQTEGMCDGDDRVGYRGWADRLAEQLSQLNPNLRYANLAIRGKNTRDTLVDQLQPALNLRPDLIAAPLGMNDVIGRADIDAVRTDLDIVYGRLADSGATVLISTFPDIAAINPLGRAFQSRLLALNALMREYRDRFGFALVDLAGAEILGDRRAWSPDRLHASPLGHDRFAAGAAHALGLPRADPAWGRPLPPLPAPNPLLRTADDARWLIEFFTPWMTRRLRGRSIGDGRMPKRPNLQPIVLPSAPTEIQ